MLLLFNKERVYRLRNVSSFCPWFSTEKYANLSRLGLLLRWLFGLETIP